MSTQAFSIQGTLVRMEIAKSRCVNLKPLKLC